MGTSRGTFKALISNQVPSVLGAKLKRFSHHKFGKPQWKRARWVDSLQEAGVYCTRRHQGLEEVHFPIETLHSKCICRETLEVGLRA